MSRHASVAQPRGCEATPASAPGLTLTQQSVASPAASCRLDASPSDIWSELADGFSDVVVDAVRDILVGIRPIRRPLVLEETMDDDVYGPVLSQLLADLDASPDHPRHERARLVISKIGDAEVIDAAGDLPLETVATCLVPLVEAADLDTPTVAVRFDDAFKARRAEQRRAVCRVLSALTRVSDVRIITGNDYQARWLAHTHHGDLPDDVRQQCNAGPHGSGPVAERVDTALDQLDVDGGVVRTLRLIGETDTETATLARLYNAAEVGQSAVRHRLQTLRDLGLVSETFETADASRVELTAAGGEYLDAVRRSDGVQSTLEAAVNRTGKQSPDMPCKHAHAREAGEGEAATGSAGRDRLPALHRVEDLDRASAVAALEAGNAGGFTVLDRPVQPRSDRASPHLWVDHDRDAVVASVEADSPMPLWVSTAHALTDRRIWKTVASPERLKDSDEFAELFDEARELLREGRCLGWLGDDVETPEEFVDALQDGRDDLLEMTKRWRHGEYNDRDQFRGAITAAALGLTGTMVHLLDVLDVDVVIDVRIPTFGHWDDARIDAVTRSLAIGAAIHSRYGQSNAFRQLFETRTEQRRWSIGPLVDRADPFGELCSAFVVSAPFNSRHSRFVDRLTSHLETPRELHEDAPEFQIDVPVRDGVGRDVHAGVVRRLCHAKGLRPTPEAVSVLSALCRSPVDVADALEQLSVESDDRHIQPDELRYGLAALDPEALLDGEATPTVRDVVAALLRADGPLSQHELAERAGRSARSVRSHLSDLVKMGLVRDVAAGYRLALSFDATERYADAVYPAYVRGGGQRPEVHKAHQALRQATNSLTGGGPTSDTDWAGLAVDLRDLEAPTVWVERVLPTLWAVGERDCYRDRWGPTQLTSVRMGPESAQQSLAMAGGGGS